MTPAIPLEGRIRIRLCRQEDSVVLAEITSSRPPSIASVFVGGRAETLLERLPRLYSVCAAAQGFAAVSACEQALGICTDKSVRRARSALVAVEAFGEHLWQVVYGWATASERNQSMAHIAEARRMPGSYAAALFPDAPPFALGSGPSRCPESRTVVATMEKWLEELVFHRKPQEWAELASTRALVQWAAETATPAAARVRELYSRDWTAIGDGGFNPLPALSDSELDALLGGPEADRFIAAPQIKDQCRETTALARTAQMPLVAAVLAEHGPGLLARVTARLVELAGLPRALLLLLDDSLDDEETRQELPEGTGIGRAEAARGCLVHRVGLVSGRVASCRILAPSQWNFHPGGVAAQALGGLRGDSAADIRAMARLVVDALDPCVAYDLEITESAAA